MNRKKTLSALSALFFLSTAQAQPVTRIEITGLPDYHASASAIYMAGSFNGWNPEDKQYRFQQDAKGNYFIELKLAEGSYEYKLTRGGWDKAECRKGGQSRENRKLTVTGAATQTLVVEEWADRFPSEPIKSTASKQVRIVDTAFAIPQLQRTRRIWVYLPKEYDAAPSKRFPVLYMNDGQNIFDDATAFSGEWGIDEFLDSTRLRSCIVVGVDNGGQKRLNEYNPYDNDRFGKGEGDAYVDFLVKSLKPFIDSRFRTLSEKKNTLIAGSSMGGLISFYAVLRYPAVFGAAGVFSPSFWITNSKIYNEIASHAQQLSGTRIFLYGGSLEGDEMIAQLNKVADTLRLQSKAKVHTVIAKDRRHNEAAWREAFPSFYKWAVEGIEN